MLNNYPEGSRSDETSFHHTTPTGSVKPATELIPLLGPLLKPPDSTQVDYENVGGTRVKSWRSGQLYRYPVPKPEGDPWQIVLIPLMRKDKLQCTAWKEQIQSILVV